MTSRCAANGVRLVYGGHVQGLAQASLTRMLPGLATVQAWDGCDHVGPAYEGDLIEFRHRLVEQCAGRDRQADAVRDDRHQARRRRRGDEILRWTPIVWAR